MSAPRYSTLTISSVCFWLTRHLVDFLVQIQLANWYFSQMARAFSWTVFRSKLPPPMAQGDVFGGGKHIHQFEVLVDHADAQVEARRGGSGW